MDQASSEGAVAPDTGAPVTQAPPAQDTAGTQTETKAESPPAVDTQKQEPKGVAKRIDELTRNWREAQRTNERLLALIEQQRIAPQQGPPKAEQEEEKGLKDFGYDEKAYRAYERQRAVASAEKAAKEVAERFRTEQEAIARRAKFDERVSAFAKTVEDYDDVVTPDTAVSEGMADAIMESDEAGALMYYLGNNPDVARKLYHLSPARAGRELQKIEDRLVAERKKAAEKPVSQAPPPAPKIEGSGDASTRIDPASPESDALSDAEWTRKREKQIENRRKK